MYFFIEQTRTTPQTLIDNGHVKISGNSIAVENHRFYKLVNKQLDKYIEQPANSTQVDITLTLVNAYTKRSLTSLFKNLEELKNNGLNVTVNWKFDEDDEELRELGEIYGSMFDIEFNLIFSEMG